MGYTAVIDYGAGNLMSVTNALRFLGVSSVETSNPDEISGASHIILPGVGAFAAAMGFLRERGLEPLIKGQAATKPFLGICLGMQMLFERSSEVVDCTGLSLIPGYVRKIEKAKKLPHMGWNTLDVRRESPLLKDVTEPAYLYYVHSFCVVTHEEAVVATSQYGESIAGVVQAGNVFGCQFHPEKSGAAGLQMLKNFCEIK